MIVEVYGNNVEKALKILKRQMQKQGITKDVKKSRFYEKPSLKRKRKREEAMRRRAKAERLAMRG
ncbi:TPA: 30S ribosomal protein S21 [Candidatus Latescibacteria bacterium]|nr:30S ribosomal protein S21 [Gemmatimonadota bacterium]HAA76122.1 30S ribosomal protein S21 [Candidatus Latescibacterota bacterium]|tara:strand:- start:56 stop:250 length:195 start_codon:yes stop_codon:yes gene_type:complete